MSDGNVFSLINLDGASDVVIKLLDMVGKAVGWTVIPKKAKANFEEGLSIYIESIKSDNTLCGIEKGAKISTARKELKQYINQGKIISYAVNDINEEAKMEIDDDWLMYFFEYAKNISNDDVQKIWGRLLSMKINGEKGVSKKLLNALSLIEPEDVELFCTLCSLTFINIDDPRRIYPFIYIKNAKYYQKYNIARYKLAQLDNLGLIEYDSSKEFVLAEKVPVLRYGSDIILLNADKRIPYGNVRFTDIGGVLYGITSIDIKDDFIKNCKRVWRHKEIGFIINSDFN